MRAFIRSYQKRYSRNGVVLNSGKHNGGNPYIKG